MARTIVDENIRYTIIINGDPAKKELHTLEAETRKLNATNKELRQEKARLIAEGQKESEAYKAVNKEIRANNATIKANEARMKELRTEVGITGLTMAQLEGEAKKLRIALRHLTPGSAEFIAMQAQLEGVNVRLRELRTGAQATAFSMGKLADQFNRYQTIAMAGVATVTGIGLALKQLIGYNKELEDQLANVRKTTGLTDDQVRELSMSFGTINTRTARLQLLKLAEEAGRLGKDSIEDVLGFVRVADKMFVALGDDFGQNAEVAIRSVGKLTDLFEVGAQEGVEFERAMEMLGSSINEVAASGATQAGYLVDFLNRTAGIGRQAKISAQDFIGFAATLDEGAQTVEVSGTVMSNVISKMFKKTEDFAKAANIPLEEFRDLLGRDVNEALLRFLEGVNRNQGGLQELVENMDGLGIDGQRATSVLGLLASSVEKVREKQALANEALKEGTSLQDEFNVKNENMAGNLEKIGKRIAAAISFKGLNEALRDGSRWVAVFVGAVDDASSSANTWRSTLGFLYKALAVGVTGLISYKAALMLITLWTTNSATAFGLQTIAAKANAIAIRIADAATHLLSAGQALLTGNITAATFAWRGFTAALAMNPFGLLLAGIATAVTAFYMFRKEQQEVLSNAEKIQREADEEVKSIRETQAAIQAKIAVIKAANLTDEQRAQAMRELRAQYKEYIPAIDKEKLTLEDIDQIQGRINTKLQERINLIREQTMLKAFEAEMQGFAQKRFELEQALYETELKRAGLQQELAKKDLSPGQEKLLRGQLDLFDAIAQNNINQLDEQEAAYVKKFQNIADKLAAIIPGVLPTSIDETTFTPAASDDDSAQKKIDALLKLRERIAELEREAELSYMEANAREIEQIKDKYAKLEKEAKGHGEELKRIYALRDDEIRLKQLEQQAKVEQDLIKAEEAHQKKIEDIRRKYNLYTREQLMQQEKDLVKSYRDQDLINEEEYQRALLEIEKKYAEETSRFRYKRRDERLRELDEYARAFSMVGQLSSNLMNAEISEMEANYQRRNESEAEFTKRMEEQEEKRKEIEKKYAGIRLLTAIAEIGAQTALAVMKVAPIVPLQIIYGALGASQIAMATAEYNRVMGFETGLYPVIDQKGRKYNASKINNPGTGKLNAPTILAGEKPEIIIDPATTRHLEMNYPEVIETIYSSAARMRGYEGGHYPKTGATNAHQGNDELLKMMMSMMAENKEAIKELRESIGSGIAAYYDDSQVRKMRERLEINETVKQSRTI